MSDDQQWQAPGDQPSGYYGAHDGPAVPPPGPPVWQPVPKPGLIPLRPIDFGTLLGASFVLLRRNPKPTFGAALIIQGITTLLSVAIVGAITFFALSRSATSAESDLEVIGAGNTGLIVVGALVAVALGVVASAVLQGIIVVEVTRQILGEKSTFRELWARVKARVPALAGWSVLVGLAIAVAFGLLAGLIAVLVLALGDAGVVAGVLVGIVGVLGGIVLIAWIGTKLSLVPSAITIERLGVGAAVRRSWSLTAGAFWRTFGIELLVFAMLNIATQVVSLPLSLVSGLAGGLLDPNGQASTTTVVVLTVIGLLTVVVTLVLGSITVVIQSGSTALIYIDRRIRTEALDLELTRYTEARHSGDGALPDPFPAPAAP